MDSEDIKQFRKQMKIPGFICLYDNFANMPTYTRKKDKNSPIYEVILTEFNLNYANAVLDDAENELLNCFSECIEEMLGGLESFSSSAKWREPDDTRDRMSRYGKSEAVVAKYHNKHDVTDSQFIYSVFSRCAEASGWIYKAFIGEFKNGVGRTALHEIFMFCRMVVRLHEPSKRITDGAYNLGEGSSSDSSCSHTMRIESSLEEMGMEQVHDQFKLLDCGDKAAVARVWVPDCVMLSVRFQNPFLFGQCKSSSDPDMKTQIWHQLIRGLLTSDTAYGVGICPEFVDIYKLFNKTEKGTPRVKMQKLHILLVNENDNFCITEFMRFINILIAIVQEKSTD